MPSGSSGVRSQESGENSVMENLAEDIQDKEPERSLLNFQDQPQAEQKPVLNESILPQEDIYDIPTFLRKKLGE
jgi:hypothetical protein